MKGILKKIWVPALTLAIACAALVAAPAVASAQVGGSCASACSGLKGNCRDSIKAALKSWVHAFP